MILYNITAIVDNDIDTEFKEWIHRLFLPGLAEDELFKSQALLKVLDSPNEGVTYCLQMIASGDKEISLFQQNQLPQLHKKSQGIWANKIYLFESKMQYIAMY